MSKLRFTFSGRIAGSIAILLSMIAYVWDVAAEDRPNIVLMMADDMGMGDTSAYQDFTGNSDDDQVHTPNMERLARMGVRFTDAHTPSSRCSPTRYALLTGRYPWRNRLKYWVLFGVQGDPMIEADRPTLATLMKDHGYRTGMVGKWHVGLRYARSDGGPADGWDDADLRRPMADTPLDHGFEFCRFTSRSHGTSGVARRGGKKGNSPSQSVGPGHIDGRNILSGTGNGKELFEDGPQAYVLNELGGRHFDSAIEFLSKHVAGGNSADQPFFLYYASNSNHAPYTPDQAIDGESVAGASRNVAGESMDPRSDFIYENDVALGGLIDFLKRNDDPRRQGHKLIDNTIIVFTSDNGAEKDSDIATGPFRSNKGSTYEGGHRVPFLVTWKAGGVGDGVEATAGETNDSLIGLQDMYATFCDLLQSDLPDLRTGQKGAEDSISVLDAWRGDNLQSRMMFFNDHKQAKDPAAVAFRLDDPTFSGTVMPGKWKLLLDASLLRAGQANPIELYDLLTDPREERNRVDQQSLQSVVKLLAEKALRHRTCGGHRTVEFASDDRHVFDWTRDLSLRGQFDGQRTSGVAIAGEGFTAKFSAEIDGKPLKSHVFDINPRGLGIDGQEFGQFDHGETLAISFDTDVIVESVAVVAGNGRCGGFYRVGNNSPLAIYCVDADIDAKDQSGILSDIGVVRAGETLRLSSSPHFGVESPGQWRIEAMTVRLIKPTP